MNRERVGKALELLNEGLRPFVDRELKGVHGNEWEDVAKEGQPPERGRGRAGGTPTPQKFHFDTQGLLAVLWNQWNVVFAKSAQQTRLSSPGRVCRRSLSRRSRGDSSVLSYWTWFGLPAMRTESLRRSCSTYPAWPGPRSK